MKIAKLLKGVSYLVFAISLAQINGVFAQDVNIGLDKESKSIEVEDQAKDSDDKIIEKEKSSKKDKKDNSKKEKKEKPAKDKKSKKDKEKESEIEQKQDVVSNIQEESKEEVKAEGTLSFREKAAGITAGFKKLGGVLPKVEGTTDGDSQEEPKEEAKQESLKENREKALGLAADFNKLGKFLPKIDASQNNDNQEVDVTNTGSTTDSGLK